MFSTVIGVVVSAIISSILSIIFSEEIIKIFKKILLKLGVLKDVDLSGVWKAVFFVENKEYVEIIKLTQIHGNVYGHIEPNEANYDKIKAVMNNKPLRLKGVIMVHFK